MSLKKHNRGVIRLGDSTTHGGKVISVANIPTDMGLPIACVGDMTVCPLCKGSFPIVEGDPECTINAARVGEALRYALKRMEPVERKKWMEKSVENTA